MKVDLHIADNLGGRAWFLDTPSTDLRPHCHDELEFNLVTCGTARYLMGQRLYDLREGTLVWLFPRQQHVLLDQSADFQMWVAVFKPAIVHQFCSPETEAGMLQDPDPPGDFARIVSQPEMASLCSLCEELSPFAEEPELHRIGMAWLLRVAWRRWKASHMDSRFEAIHPAVEKAVRLLRQNHSIPLPELAARSGLSPSRLSRVFKADVGYAVSTFRNHCRIQTFLDLYGAGKRRTMLDCALESGFGSYEQFHRTFKRQLGCSPAEYRRRMVR